ncbi:conserved hypothetical protein [Xenorhabdus bovienii str. Jollieti]|uniref:Sucrose phosphatase-like domain-containing protein n=1 Tax=Xenorhabdus bovienii (strain SS-2004) TaxID=406818 RepID=D3V2D9_XENBS|nr:hypothetical protein [Xenorhabdus bovienii]CBJ80904.1 conserved hypothetical protein [Xenorhabdus bovienii SS-2004]CDH30597.1 conserved hypothetical protein [Xenorhabdus bovienii str. Jollieti]
MIKPVFLTDLDDTLFQTRRKIKKAPDIESCRVGALDRKYSPCSYMTEEQSILIDWLLAYAEVIPVTARNTEQLSRVKIPFNSWRIAAHGAVLLTPESTLDQEWQAHILAELTPYRDQFRELEHLSHRLIAAHGIEAWARIDYEYGDVPVYLVIKHRDCNRLEGLDVLAENITQEMADVFDSGNFYLHQNNNNLTLLPKCIDKGLATRHLLTRLRTERGVFPIIGLGDSLSDHRFMKLCNWFGMPQHSQFANTLMTSLFGTVNNE